MKETLEIIVYALAAVGIVIFLTAWIIKVKPFRKNYYNSLGHVREKIDECYNENHRTIDRMYALERKLDKLKWRLDEVAPKKPQPAKKKGK